MTDHEMTQLCAQAMNLEVGEVTGYLYIMPLILGVGADGKNKLYDPLHDDAQAMALVKKFYLNITRFPHEEWQVNHWTGKNWTRSCLHVDLTRAICECVAKMEESKYD